jgi:1-acyl-sn-glycerol-3-phosphate acyltransferase
LAYAAYIGSLLALVAPILWGLLLVTPGGRPADRLVRLACRVVLALSGCRVHVQGAEHLRGVAPAIVAANHASYLDAVILLASLPPGVRFIAKRELASFPLIGTVIRKVGHLAVERTAPTQSAADAERATAVLRGGASLFFFPEGTFRRAPGLLPFRLGAFKAAVETGCPVIPIGIQGTRAILPADTWLPTPGPITVAVGAPIMPQGSGWPEMVRLRDLARTEIARLAGERFSPARGIA